MLINLAIKLACSLISGSTLAQAICPAPGATPIAISNSVPQTASRIIPEAFVSFAIEFSHFPDYAGTLRLVPRILILTRLKQPCRQYILAKYIF